MVSVELKLPLHVIRQRFSPRHPWQFYVRLPGRPKIRLRAEPGTDAFQREYEAAIASTAPIPDRGTFGALCRAYYRSATFRALDRSTRNWRRHALDLAAEKHGAKPVALMEPKHVRRLRDELADKPVVANKRVKAIKALFKWAVNAGECDTNPAHEVDLLRELTREHHTWTIEEVEQFETFHGARAATGDARSRKALLAMALMLYTAGRREDAVRLGPQHIRIVRGLNGPERRVQFVQAKNEHRRPVKIDVPLHPDLAAVIGRSEIGDLCFLTTEYGRPFTPNGFGNWFRERCEEAGVPGRAHGLRKALCVRLANSGATAHEIMAWSGHLTLEEVEVYTRAAARARNADAALVKLREGGG